MTTLSRISMAAAAALLVGFTPATAADLGGNCCADLEERVAELEATTVRKGTRKVSVTISGQISQQLMFWDDGFAKDVYVSGPTQSNSRWRLTGAAKVSPEITAGFLYEFEAFASQSSSQNQTNGAGPTNTIGAPNNFGDDAGSGDNLREAMAWVEHGRLGRVSIGHGSSAANNVILVDLSGKGMGASNDVRLHSSGMRMFANNATVNGVAAARYLASSGTAGATWANFFQGGQDWLNERVEHIQYRTPTIAGFTLGASFGEDNYWDVALRYAGEFNGIRLAGAIGYSVRSEYNASAASTGATAPVTPDALPTVSAGGLTCNFNCAKAVDQLAGSLSIRHMPTGLFFTGAAGKRETSGAQVITGVVEQGSTVSTTNGLSTAFSYDSSFFYLSGGVARNFFGIGDTVLFGEYSQWKGTSAESLLHNEGTAAEPILVYGSENDKLTHWGVGIVQHVDAAAMEFWLTYKNYSLSGPSAVRFGGIEDLHYIQAGTRIRF